MLEIPESRVIGTQANEALAGKKIRKVVNATNPHKFTWYNGNPEEYPHLLVGRTIQNAKGHGMYVDLHFDSDIHLSIGDGTNMRYHLSPENKPLKHQLMLIFEDESFLVFTVAMYGGIFAYKGTFDNSYYQGSLNSISPLDPEFDKSVFENIFKSVQKDLSIKALLATEQRIPGLGNGVLQDILFNANIHPKRKISTFSDFEIGELFHSLKFTLNSMTEKNGRDTEKDLFGNFGNYHATLSKNTYKDPCPICGEAIIKEAYLGGSIYYCPVCQKLK